MSDVQTPFQLLVDIDQRCRRLAAGLPAQQEAVQSWSGIGFRMGGRFFVGHCCKVSDEAAFCLIQRPYISKTLLT
ncbi:hypothetical protein LF840_26385, partial [Pseudomonas aeruginosa]|nr:hypothetical protein [Pseudomonas aeruginosa]